MIPWRSLNVNHRRQLNVKWNVLCLKLKEDKIEWFSNAEGGNVWIPDTDRVGLRKIKINISYGRIPRDSLERSFNATHATAIFIKPGSIRLTGRFKVSRIASGRSSRSNIHEREIQREDDK